MNNSDIAAVFDRIADLLEIKGEIIYKTLAYRRAAESLRNLGEDIATLHREGRLTEIPAVGKAIAEKIAELLTTGKLEFLQKIEEEVPPTLTDLLQVTDVGPKKVALFWRQAGITTLPQLEAAAREGRLRGLPGMGEKSEARVLEGLEALKRRSKRRLLGNVRPVAQRWVAWLKGFDGVARAEAAGSVRRWKPTIGDLDLVIGCEDASAVMEAFAHHPQVARILRQGENKSSMELVDGLNIQLWSQPPERFGTLLQFVTGSKEHNVRLRELAQKKGLSLSERCLTRSDGSEVLFDDEEKLYKFLGLSYIPPELREDRGEIQAAVDYGHLPRMMLLNERVMELHCHTTWSDGANSIEQMAEAAVERGLKVLAITDHSSGLGIVGGLDAERLRQQRVEIDVVQARMGDRIRLLQGAEVEIHADGTLEHPDEVLAALDIVIASLHTSLRQPREQVTARLLKVMRNPHVDIIGHPTGRLMPEREGADLDMEQVLQAAKENGVALEINCSPSRLDLDEVYARRAAEMEIPLAINTDAHSTAQLDYAELGVSVARRGWVWPMLVVNTWSEDWLMDWLRGRG